MSTVRAHRMARLELWWSDRAFDLERTIRHDPSDFAGIDASLHSITEEFWNAWRSPDLGVALDTFRAGDQYGGLQDRWREEDDTSLGPVLVV